MPEDDFVSSKRHSYVSVENLLINVLFYNSINTFRWLIDEKLIIRVVGVLFLVGFLIYLFYSPRLKFDVLENPNKGNKVNRSEQVNKSNNHAENQSLKKGVGTWVGKDIKVLTSKFGQADRVYPFRDGYKIMYLKTKQLLHCFN